MTCANCGGPVSNRGPKPDSGRRYCMNEECQRAKWAAASSERAIPARFRADAPTKCSGCAIDLPARKVRLGDSPHGRWCRRPSCQRQRREIEQSPEVREYHTLLNRYNFLMAMLTDPRPRCVECGCPDTVSGFVHPAGDLGPCNMSGNIPVPQGLGAFAWPWVPAVIEWVSEHPDVELDRDHSGIYALGAWRISIILKAGNDPLGAHLSERPPPSTSGF